MSRKTADEMMECELDIRKALFAVNTLAEDYFGVNELDDIQVAAIREDIGQINLVFAIIVDYLTQAARRLEMEMV